MSKANAKGEERGEKREQVLPSSHPAVGLQLARPADTPPATRWARASCWRNTAGHGEPRKHAAHLTLLQNREGFSCLSSSKAGQGSVK